MTVSAHRRKARISLPDEGVMNAEQQRVRDMIVNGRRGTLVGPLRAALHNPALAERWSQLGECLRFNTKLPSRLSELAILVTARRWNSDLEWAVHRKAAEAAGLETGFINAISRRQVPDFRAEADREIYQYAVELLEAGTVSDAVYATVVARWGEAGVVEITALIGYYCMVALTLNAHQLPLPEDLDPELDKPRNARGAVLSDLPALPARGV